MQTDDKQSGARALEFPTDHRCLLGELTDRLAEHASRGVRGEDLASHARQLLTQLLGDGRFHACCAPLYMALAPETFEREIQLPIASAVPARLDTRVLLWPVGAKDGQHPHCDGWAVFAAVQGELVESEERDGQRQPAKAVALCEPALLMPEDSVSHHIHNVGHAVGLTIHVFGT
jgi:hypothetical protein